MYFKGKGACLLFFLYLGRHCALGQPPGCFYGGDFVQWCNHGPWQQWNCYTCATIQQATRERELCCQDKQMPKQECYAKCEVSDSAGVEHSDCTNQCGLAPDTVCQFADTNETLALCAFSSWLSWDCKKCLDNNPGNTRKTDRKRAICCGTYWMKDAASCLNICGQAEHSDTEEDFCVDVCPLMSSTGTTTTSSISTTSRTTTEPDSTLMVLNELGIQESMDAESFCDRLQGQKCYIGPWILESNPNEKCM